MKYLKGIKDYAKCAVYNRITLAGLALTGVGGVGLSQADSVLEGLAFSFTAAAGVTALMASRLAIDTYRLYKTTKRQIERGDAVSVRSQNKFTLTYCYDRGVKLALKEAEIL